MKANAQYLILKSELIIVDHFTCICFLCNMYLEKFDTSVYIKVKYYSVHLNTMTNIKNLREGKSEKRFICTKIVPHKKSDFPVYQVSKDQCPDSMIVV